jgi:hypothetical protein
MTAYTTPSKIIPLWINLVNQPFSLLHSMNSGLIPGLRLHYLMLIGMFVFGELLKRLRIQAHELHIA